MIAFAYVLSQKPPDEPAPDLTSRGCRRVLDYSAGTGQEPQLPVWGLQQRPREAHVTHLAPDHSPQ
jgi:hypothetical protein